MGNSKPNQSIELVVFLRDTSMVLTLCTRKALTPTFNDGTVERRPKARRPFEPKVSAPSGAAGSIHNGSHGSHFSRFAVGVNPCQFMETTLRRAVGKNRKRLRFSMYSDPIPCHNPIRHGESREDLMGNFVRLGQYSY